jgi:hypothetical protein
MSPKVCQDERGIYLSIDGKGTDRTTTSTDILACQLPFLIIPDLNNLLQTSKLASVTHYLMLPSHLEQAERY